MRNRNKEEKARQLMEAEARAVSERMEAEALHYDNHDGHTAGIEAVEADAATVDTTAEFVADDETADLERIVIEDRTHDELHSADDEVVVGDAAVTADEQMIVGGPAVIADDEVIVGGAEKLCS